MVKLVVPVLAASVALLGFALQTKPEQVVQRTYEGEGAKIEGLGACNITVDRVECWDMDGAPSADLAGRITTFLNGSTYGGDLNFRFGKKNRWLVVRKTGSIGMSLQVQGSSGNGFQVYGQGVPNLDVLRANPDPNQESANVLVTFYSLPGPTPVVVPFRLGEKISYAGTEVEIGPSKEWKATPEEIQRINYGHATGKYWRVVLGARRAPDSSGAGAISYTVLGKDGNPIRYVDKNGEPVSDIKVLSEAPSNSPGGPTYYPGNLPSSDKYPPVVFSPNGPSTADAMTAYTNVNPARIGALRLSSTLQKTVEIDGFPLDPK